MDEVILYQGIVRRVSRCPHCSVAKPLLDLLGDVHEHYVDAFDRQFYAQCSNCRSFVLFHGYNETYSKDTTIKIEQMFPELQSVDQVVPERPRNYLKQAIESQHAPDGAILLCASALDAMLKDQGYRKGNLFSRIDKAQEEGLITSQMQGWAHETRLAANEQRHADEEVEITTEEDAVECINLTKAFAEYLYVLPSKIRRWKQGEEE